MSANAANRNAVHAAVAQFASRIDVNIPDGASATSANPICGVSSTAINSGISTSQFSRRLRAYVATDAHVSADRMASFGVR